MESLKRWDAAIRRGNLGEVAAEIDKITLAKIPRAAAPEFARTARRAGRADIALRVLVRWVRSEKESATPRERAEYAATLIQVGALSEAKQILDTLPDSLSETLLYRAYLAIPQRDYGEAIEWFRRYLSTSGLTSYARLVARVGLAEALAVEGNVLRADRMLQELLHTASLQKLTHLLARTLTVAGELAFAQGRNASAERLLRKAGELSSSNVSTLILRKWHALTRGDAKDLATVAADAAKAGQWEIQRDCDRERAALSKDEALLAHVYFGTPYPAYRRRLGFTPPESYVWGGTKRVLDPSKLRRGMLPQRLLACLAKDFYRPSRTAALFVELNPDEHYHPVHAPPRVHVAIQRLRRWLEKEQYDLVVIDADGAYRLLPTKQCGIRVHAQAARSPEAEAAAALEIRFGHAPVSLKQIGQVLKLPDRSAHRLVVKAVAEGLLTRTGAGAQTRYRLAKSVR